MYCNNFFYKKLTFFTPRAYTFFNTLFRIENALVRFLHFKTLVWTPPLDRSIKINVDGAWDSTSHVAGTGVIIRGTNGKFIAGSALSSSTSSIIEAEATALVNGIKVAVQLNLENVILESDSQEIMTALDNHIERGNWRIYPFLTEFHRLRAALCNVSWRWISRQANRAADAAAKLAKSRLCTDVWVNRPFDLQPAKLMY